MPLGKTFRVYHRQCDDQPYCVILEQRSISETLVIYNGVTLLLAQTEAEILKKKCTRLSDVYGVLGILQLDTSEGDVSYLVLINSCLSVGKILNSEIFRITETTFISLRNSIIDVERIQEVRKVLNSGTFYFSWCSSTDKPLDLTLCEQRASCSAASDNRFFWNRTMHLQFIRDGIECKDWLLKVMCGGVEIRTVYVGHLQAKGCIISRLSSERAGTRFNVRGTNDDGNVANFVETEQVIYLDDKICSYIQIRGSIPLFWEQPGLQVGSHKVKLSRGSEAAAPAFDRHLTQITQHYGSQVLINLLGSKEGESMLSKMFQNHHKASRYNKMIPYVAFDYHSMCHGGKQDNLNILKNKISQELSGFGFFHSEGGETLKYQTGTFRTNCLDCLDRTNAVQTFIGLEVLQLQLVALGYGSNSQITSRFTEVFKQMWIKNGDQVSKMYAGTGALEGKSKLKDGSRSVVRTIQNNLLDSSKQGAIDALLFSNVFNSEVMEVARSLLPTNMLNLSSDLLRKICFRRQDFCGKQRLRIAVATWNVNGGKHFNSIVFKHQSMTEWLLDSAKLSGADALLAFDENEHETPIDIFAIGFEEIVDLNAGNIVAASTQNQREWLAELQKTISRDHKYIYITSTQLVGVCLFLFALPKHAPHIRDVCTDFVKTGLGGTAGNKGGVAIRMMLYNSSLCFVCSHFAAGQSQIVERNADYNEIRRRLFFHMGRNMDMHDYVFWCGDFNYRIDQPNDIVRELAKQKNWSALLSSDQLVTQKAAGQVFVDFVEGEVNFAPTYKYDIFSDDYDTSEKNRIPSWTDRVLYKKKMLPGEDESQICSKIAYYGRAELKTSDHRPVIAYIDIEVLVVNKEQRLEVVQEIIASGPPDGCILAHLNGENPEFDVKNLTKCYNILCDLYKDRATSIRPVGNLMLVKFSDGTNALEACQDNNEKINGETLTVKLKTPEWITAVHDEIKLCGNNTLPLFRSSKDLPNMSPYGELDCDQDEIVNQEILDCLTSGSLSGMREIDYLEVEDDDLPKSQCSSGRSSPILDSPESKNSKSGTLVKGPPRPPPPRQNVTQTSKISVNPPQRPPPPRPNPPSSSKPSNEESICVGVSVPGVTNPSVEHQESPASCESDMHSPSYMSCPPLSEPPPLPPAFRHSVGKPVPQMPVSCEAQLSDPKHPPPIPSRPRPLPPAVASVSHPPPIPARSNIVRVPSDIKKTQ